MKGKAKRSFSISLGDGKRQEIEKGKEYDLTRIPSEQLKHVKNFFIKVEKADK